MVVRMAKKKTVKYKGKKLPLELEGMDCTANPKGCYSKMYKSKSSGKSKSFKNWLGKKVGPGKKLKGWVWVVIIIGLIGVPLVLFGTLGALTTQPAAPEHGIGYAQIKFYDPYANQYINGTYDLVTVENTSHFYQQDVVVGETVHLTNACYAIIKSASYAGFDYFNASIGVEANVYQHDPYVNVINVYRVAPASDIVSQITYFNGTFGNFTHNDVYASTTINFTTYIKNNNLSNQIAHLSWLPPVRSSATAVSLNATGTALWVALVGEGTAPIAADTVVQVNYMNMTVYNVGVYSCIKLAVVHEEEYANFVSEVPIDNDVANIILYRGQVDDFNVPENVLHVYTP